MAQLMPLPLTVSSFSKIQIGFTFLVLAHPDNPGKRAVKCVCVCLYRTLPCLHFFLTSLLPYLSFSLSIDLLVSRLVVMKGN